MIALAALSIGSSAFAYAGGFKQLIESLFATVNIDGKATPMEMQPVGENAYEGAMQKQLEDGGQADIHVRHEETTPFEKRTHVRVKNVGRDGSGDEITEEIGVVMRFASLADLGVAKHSWSTADGVAKALHIVPDAEAGLLRVFTTSRTGQEDLVIRFVRELPSDTYQGDPEIAIADDGEITLIWEIGDGQERRRAKIQINEEPVPDPVEVRIPTKSGVEVRIPTKLPRQ
jgi:hypothetical protein